MAVVSDYTALLYYTHYAPGRWNAVTDVGTQTIVSYSFTDNADLMTLEEYDPYGANSYWAYTEAQRTLMREVFAKFEAVAGIKFVEIEGESMINIFGADVDGVGGWANIPSATSGGADATNNGQFVNAYQDMDEGDYGYQVNLHELGHALGLQHPHEGPLTLDPSVDTQANTVMTYNIENPYVTELGGFDIQALQEIYGAPGGFAKWKITVDVNDVITIKTSSASEVILGVDSAQVIFGFGGDDEIIGREAGDKIFGGMGEDTVIGAAGSDSVFAGGDDDLVYGHISDAIHGGASTDNDRLFGNAGNDTLHGGDGKDTLNGGSDDDMIYGGYGRDRIIGGSGNDTIEGGRDIDRMWGGTGQDLFVFTNEDQYAKDKIADFEETIDTIDLSSFGFMTFASLNIVQNGNHTDISYSDWFGVRLLNFDANDLTIDDFAFV